MKNNPLSRLAAVAAVALASSSAVDAAVITGRTLDRLKEAVVVTGAATPGFAGLAVNNADVTLAPNEIFAWAYDGATTSWRQVVFQIDEVSNTYPDTPPPDMGNGCGRQRGRNYYGATVTSLPNADDGLWDANDELVFMSDETGDRVSLDTWAPGADTVSPRYEITVIDPLDTAKKGWVYLFRHLSVPTWSSADYVAWNDATNTITATAYAVDRPDSDQNAAYFTSLTVSAAAGGTGANLVQRSKIFWRGGAGTDFDCNEGCLRTQHTFTGGSCQTWNLPWVAKDGRVRVIRYYQWVPYNLFFAPSGVGWHPPIHVFYDRYGWHEQSWLGFWGGSYNLKYLWETINHQNTVTMTFYDSNGETATIDGVAETPAIAQKPLWTWNQVSSARGSYVQVMRNSTLPAADRWNLYTENGTGQRGDAGWYLSDPVEDQNQWGTHHDRWFFFLPANAPNEGAAWNDRVNSPLAVAGLSQNYGATATGFDGILTATDVGGACVDSGVEVTWDAVLNWNDGCVSSCTSRKYEIRRSGVLVRTETDTAVSAWTDTTGVNGTSYDYNVEACNQNGACTVLATVIAARDYVGATPLFAVTPTAVDADSCVGTGVTLTWGAPSDWRDGGEGSRRFDLYWDADGFAAPIATDVTSPHLHDAPDGVARTYRVRATNGCDLATSSAASAAAIDAVGSNPTLPAIVDTVASDLASCSFSGIQVAWNAVASWGDGGAGSRRYDLYWSGDGYAAPLMTNVTSPVNLAPPDSGVYGYRVRAVNGCGLTTDYVAGSGADAQTAPAFAGAGSVSDPNLCAASALTITWTDINGDGASGWNDGGVGAGGRLYRIYRDGVEIANSPKADGLSSTTDTPPAPNVSHAYTVRAYNGQGCFTAGAGAVSGSDAAGVAPAASPAATTATELSCSAVSGVTISWDAPTDWGDNGSGVASRRFLLYWSANGYASPIASFGAGTTSTTWFPPADAGYRYRVVARNGCSQTRIYAESGWTIDRSSCAPSCTIRTNATYNAGADGFGETCDGGKDFWTLTAGAGYSGTQAWVADVSGGGGNRNSSAALELTTAVSITWTTDVKLRFWSASSLSSDDAGVVEVWTSDSNVWRKLQTIAYPNSSATVPASVATNCPTDVPGGTQPAFQGNLAGTFFEGRLDSLLTASTATIKVRFKVASGATSNTSTWTIDEVQVGYGITDGVYYWSNAWDASAGVLPAGGGEGTFRWDDGGLYQTTEFRIYRSSNPAAMRTDPSSTVVRIEPDTDAETYSWTSADGNPPGGLWCYQVYGWKLPCGESNAGEN